MGRTARRAVRNEAGGSRETEPRARGMLGLPQLVVRNLAAKALSEIPIKLVRLAMLVLGARWLGRSGFGAFSYALSIGYILIQAADLGLQFHLARSISRHPSSAAVVLRRVLRSKLALLAFVGVVFVLAGAAAGVRQERWLFWILGAALMLNSLVELGNYLYRGFQRLAFEARVNLLNVGLGTTAGLVAVRLGAGPLGLAAGLLAGAGAALAWTMATIHRRFIPASRWLGGFGSSFGDSARRVDESTRQDGESARELGESGSWFSALRSSLPIGIAILLSVLGFRIDVLFLRHYHGVEAVGLYAAAYRIVESFMFVPGILLAAIFPAYADMTVRQPEQLSRFLRVSLLWLLTLAALPSFGLLALAGPLTRLAYGSMYEAAAVPLRILGPGLLLIFLNYGLTHFLIALGRAKMNALIAGVCLAVNAAGNWLLIPRYGMIAAAAMTIVTEGVLFGLAFFLVRRSLKQVHRADRRLVAAGFPASPLISPSNTTMAGLGPPGDAS